MTTPASRRTDREMIEKLHETQQEMMSRLNVMDKMNEHREKTMEQIKLFQEKQQALNVRRETAFSEMKAELAYNNELLKKLSSLWFPIEGEQKQKSHAIGTWPGWKVVAGLFTILGGLVLAYQILVPVLIALNNALLTATPFK